MITWKTHFVLYIHANLPTPLVHCQPPFRYPSFNQVGSEITNNIENKTLPKYYQHQACQPTSNICM